MDYTDICGWDVILRNYIQKIEMIDLQIIRILLAIRT